MKPAGYVEQPKSKTRRVGLGRVTIPVDAPQANEESAVRAAPMVKKPETKSWAAVVLNPKAKAMMDEGDKRSANEASLFKKEQKKIRDKANKEAYLQREARRQAKRAMELEKAKKNA